MFAWNNYTEEWSQFQGTDAVVMELGDCKFNLNKNLSVFASAQPYAAFLMLKLYAGRLYSALLRCKRKLFGLLSSFCQRWRHNTRTTTKSVRIVLYEKVALRPK